ncbi:MAG TPA: sigma-70 family RNA polymerase sigma factor [Candidatus Dormibacteraeota bacterium]|jgi:RNA polymerase sigma-70 factor (ECF subfamily)|nr:sigma-70 family RNA polymerase sigma factor [Candidatus Dormibacteraeota bacterium]
MGQPDQPASDVEEAEERRLIDRSATGDQEAFRQLVLRYHRLVMNVSFRALGEMSLAEDVAQEVFIKVYKALPGYRHDKPFKHWLHRVAANAVTDALRRRRPVVSLDGLEELPAAKHSDPQDVAARHDLQRAVRHAIASLPPHYRDTIALQAFGELSYDEIARALDIPLGTVMSRLNGAKRLLRETLGDLARSYGEEANTA